MSDPLSTMGGGPPLVGRRAELGLLSHRIVALAGGAGGCVVLEGPAGIGKTRLLAEAVGRAGADGLAVGVGRVSDVDRVTPLGVLLRALSGIAPPVVDDAALRRMTAEDADRWHLVAQLSALIEEYATRCPLVVVLDDVHRADELTALALRVLTGELRSSPVLWLLARRSSGFDPANRAAVDWMVANGAETMLVPPLDPGEVAEFCTRVNGRQPDEATAALADRSGGNPFLLHQLLTTLASDRDLVKTESLDATEGRLPAHFVNVVDRRLAELPPPARRLLDVAAVLGRPFTLHEVAGLTGTPAVRLLAPADVARTAGLLVDSGSELTFAQDIVREAVYQQLSGPVRHALHREAAAVVRRAGRPASEVVEHLIRSAHRGDRQVAALTREVAAGLALRAPGTAADLLIRALDFVAEGDSAYEEVAGEAVRLLATAGRLDESRRLGDSVLRYGLAPEAEAALRLGLSEALKHAGADAAAVEHADAGLARVGVPEAVRAHLHAVRAHALLCLGDFDPADRAGAQAVRSGNASGTPAATAFGLTARSVAAQALGQVERAVTIAREAADLADETGGEARRRHPLLWVARALTAADGFGEAAALLELGQREADQLGTTWSQPLWHYHRARLWLASGRLGDAEAEAQAGCDVTDRLGAHGLAVPLLGLCAEVAVHRDDLDAARTRLSRARQLLASGAGAVPEDLARATLLVAEAGGDPAAALRELATVYANLPRRPLLLAQDPSSAAPLVRLALGQGELALARTTVAAAKRLAEFNPRVPTAAAAAVHVDGLLAADLRRLTAAVVAYRASPRPFALASALEDVAAAHLRRGGAAAARSCAEEALEIYERCGAYRDHARARRQLQETGVRRPPPTNPAKTGWASLSEAELRVVRLVAQGHSNRATAERLFLSPHTVDTHLRHAFAKLGLASRVELTRHVLAHDRDHIT